jgi:hypothetical protein
VLEQSLERSHPSLDMSGGPPEAYSSSSQVSSRGNGVSRENEGSALCAYRRARALAYNDVE